MGETDFLRDTASEGLLSTALVVKKDSTLARSLSEGDVVGEGDFDEGIAINST